MIILICGMQDIQVKTKIKETINPRKWICVGVEEEDVIVKNKGDLIILIMLFFMFRESQIDYSIIIILALILFDQS